MKSIVLATALVAAPLCAQMTPAPSSPPASKSAPATTAATPSTATGTAASKFSLDTPIETIVADPAGKAVLEADFPGMTSHPMYDSFKSMSLTQLQPMSQGQITDEQIAKAKADLAAVK